MKEEMKRTQVVEIPEGTFEGTVLIVSMQIGMTRIATVEYIAVVLTADIIIRAIETVVFIINKKRMLHSGAVKPHNN